MIPVNEIFDTIQGEAFYTGTPSTFVRLQGCAVGCPWCDTKHTWAVNPEKKRPLAAILEKTDRAVDTYANVTLHSLLGLISARLPRHVVITGGEPCDYDLTELTEGLIGAGRSVQIETSATAPVRASASTWVTVSPKVDMPGGKPVLTDVIKRANEIKMPVGKPADVTRLVELLERYKPSTDLIWLQPLSASAKATALCVIAATEHGWRVSVQTHKFIGVR